MFCVKTLVLCVLAPNGFKLVFKLDRFTEYFFIQMQHGGPVGQPGLRSGVFGADQTDIRLLLSDIRPDLRGAERGFGAKRP